MLFEGGMFLFSSYLVATMAKKATKIEIRKTISNPRDFKELIVKANSKTSSKLYLPVDWEGEKVCVILL